MMLQKTPQQSYYTNKLSNRNISHTTIIKKNIEISTNEHINSPSLYPIGENNTNDPINNNSRS